MKKTTTIFCSLLIPIFLTLFSGRARAQDNYGDTLYSVYSADVLYPVEHQGLIHPYTGPTPLIVFGVLFTLMGYVIFRYWWDNRGENGRSTFTKYSEVHGWY